MYEQQLEVQIGSVSPQNADAGNSVLIYERFLLEVNSFLKFLLL
jgi:hypothetical protein